MNEPQAHARRNIFISRSSHLLVLPGERFGRAVPLQSHCHGHLSPGYSERRRTPRTNAGLLKPQGRTPGDTLESKQRARLWESPNSLGACLPSLRADTPHHHHHQKSSHGTPGSVTVAVSRAPGGRRQTALSPRSSTHRDLPQRVFSQKALHNVKPHRS